MGAAASVDAGLVQRVEAVFASIDTSGFQSIDRAELGALFARDDETRFEAALHARKWILVNDQNLNKKVCSPKTPPHLSLVAFRPWLRQLQLRCHQRNSAII
jgi:ketosteroid isomerase-like protein